MEDWENSADDVYDSTRPRTARERRDELRRRRMPVTHEETLLYDSPPPVDAVEVSSSRDTRGR